MGAFGCWSFLGVQEARERGGGIFNVLKKCGLLLASSSDAG